MKPHPQVWVEAESDVISMLYWLKHRLSRGRHLVWWLGDLIIIIFSLHHLQRALRTHSLISCMMWMILFNLGSKPWKPTKIGRIKACVACIPVLWFFHGLSSYIYWSCRGLLARSFRVLETACNTLCVYMLKVKRLKCAGSFRKYDNALSLQFCQFFADCHACTAQTEGTALTKVNKS